MSSPPERRPERPEPKTGTRAGPVRYSVPDAAQLLGISERAVRKRIAAGTVIGFPSGRSYVVEIPDPAAPAPERAGPGSGPVPEPNQARAAQDRTSLTALVAVKDDMISAQRNEIEFLREQLDQRSRELSSERERADTIQQMALLRIEALTAGDVETNDPAQDQRTASTAAPGATEAPESTPNTLHEPSVVTSWLRRLFGRS